MDNFITDVAANITADTIIRIVKILFSFFIGVSCFFYKKTFKVLKWVLKWVLKRVYNWTLPFRLKIINWYNNYITFRKIKDGGLELPENYKTTRLFIYKKYMCVILDIKFNGHINWTRYITYMDEMIDGENTLKNTIIKIYQEEDSSMRKNINLNNILLKKYNIAH